MCSDVIVLSIFSVEEVNNFLPVSSYFIWEKEKALLSDTSKFKDLSFQSRKAVKIFNLIYNFVFLIPTPWESLILLSAIFCNLYVVGLPRVCLLLI